MHSTLRWAACALALSLASGALADDVPTTAKGEGIVTAGAVENGKIWFSLWDKDRRYEARVADVSDVDAVFSALKDSNKTSRNLVVDYDIDSGDIDPDTGVTTFVFRDVVYGDKRIPGDQSPASSRRLHTNAPGPLIARAMALADNPQEGKADLDLALKASALTPTLRAAALKTRAEVQEDLALYWTEFGAARDTLLVDALADERAYRQLHPENADGALEEVDLLDYLGDYPAALRVLQAIRSQWPKEDFAISVKIAATYRMMGDDKAALQTLDDLVARAGPQDGMKYHYHRSWILIDLGRAKEAAEELTQGLKSQPDYNWAFQRRACAFAMEGRLKEALDDQETVVRLSASYVDSSPEAKFNTAWRAKVADRLRAAVMSGSMSAVRYPCTGNWDDGVDGPRARSALLTTGN